MPNTYQPERLAALIGLARTLHTDAVKRERIKPLAAADLLWLAVERATDALVLARTDIVPDDLKARVSALANLAKQQPDCLSTHRDFDRIKPQLGPSRWPERRSVLGFKSLAVDTDTYISRVTRLTNPH